MNRLALFLLIVPMTACVAKKRFTAQQEETSSQKSRADDVTAKLDKAKLDLKAVGDQLASAQTSNKDLQQALDAKKGELSQKVSDLIKERDSLTRAAAEAQAAKAAAELEKANEVAQVKKSYEDLTAGLKSEITNGEIKITQLQGKLTVNLVDRILFDSGKAEVKGAGKSVLDKVGSILNTVKDKNIRIEGHTDNKPIVGELLARYPSNWELSTARATAVARYLQDSAKVDPSRLVATGYGEFRPVASNDAPETRALNRRIEIVLVPRD
jgi:chemotaxis protein MotB